MGNATLEQQIGTPIDNNLIALVITNQTEKVIAKMQADPTNFFLKEKINFRGDTLLHYACAKNNNRLVEYIVKKNPQLTRVKNQQNQLPAELTSDEIIKAVCESKYSAIKV